MANLLTKIGDEKSVKQKLSDLIKIKHGFAFKGEYFGEKGSHVVVTPGNFFEKGGFRRRTHKDKWYSGPIFNDYILQKDDLIVAMTEQGEGLLGSSGMIPSGELFLHNQRIGLVEVKNEKVVNKKYLYYLFNSRRMRSHIKASASGTKVRHTSPDRISAYEYAFPSLPTQRKIVEILEAYDDKTENNNLIIKKLETLAETIFNEWFIAFRFPGHEETKFIESELGEIPENWNIKNISAVADLNKGVSYTSKEINTESQGVALINLGNFQRGGGFNPDGTKYYTGEYKESHSVKPGQILIAMTDLTSNREVIGHPARLPENFKEAVISLDVCSLTPQKSIYVEFLYQLMLRRDFSKLMASCASGTNVSHLSKGHIEGYSFVLPSNQVLTKFNDLVQPMFTQQAILGEENLILRESKDRLLAKLI